MAQAYAQGMPIYKAGELAGWSDNNSRRVAKLPEFKERVEKYRKELRAKSTEVTVHNRHWVDHQLRKVFDRCMQAEPVTVKGKPVERECETCGGMIGEYRFDAKNAIAALHMFGLEQGMYKRQLDVTSRKGEMIEGSQEQIIDRLAQLFERLGLAAIAQLMDRLGEESVTAALSLNGYTIEKRKDGYGIDIDDAASGDTGNGRDAGESDAQSLPALSEAAVVS
jgi:alkanesulfonate monooxygenase SsuD/methylene tetrahydromethanopterin reductase-like flavin-dependent oxidoreductase (luciferase family)